jgi:NDP-sugar pyrophosphorylase family protein
MKYYEHYGKDFIVCLGQQLIGYACDGFWTSMDTFKDKQRLETLWGSGAAPWEAWETARNAAGANARIPSETPCIP